MTGPRPGQGPDRLRANGSSALLAAYQGGTNGGLCADVFPLQDASGTWNLYEDPNAPAVTQNEPCLRGHVPQSENSAVGGALGAFAQNQRVLDLEKYTVLITN